MSYILIVAQRVYFSNFNLSDGSKLELINYIFRIKVLQDNEQGDAMEFIVTLCHDVLLEALLFGDRRRLTKLERVGRRFHWAIENFFRERPFLRLDLRIYEYLFVFTEIYK